MKKLLISLLSITSLGSALHAQNILNAKSPEEIRKKEVDQIYDSSSNYYDEPLAYEKVSDDDIGWSRMVWENIDLRDTVNQIYYYPTDTMTADRGYVSLFDALMTGIEKGDIKNVYADSYFRQKLTKAEMKENMERIDTLNLGIEQANAGEKVSQEYIDKIKVQATDIRGFKIRGLWYFDKRLGALRYRLLGIAPVAPDVYQRNSGQDNANLVELFWLWYPDARKTLHKYKVFNPKNAAPTLSYDDLLNARRFNSSIYKVSNGAGNKSLRMRYRGDSSRQAAEAQRLKNQILDAENDQWSY